MNNTSLTGIEKYLKPFIVCFEYINDEGQYESDLWSSSIWAVNETHAEDVFQKEVEDSDYCCVSFRYAYEDVSNPHYNK